MQQNILNKVSLLPQYIIIVYIVLLGLLRTVFALSFDQDAIETIIKPLFSNYPGNVIITIKAPDSSTALKACNDNINYHLPNPQPNNKMLLQLKCVNPYWSFYLPLEIRVINKVIATKNLLTRNHVIQASDLILVDADLLSLRDGYFTNIEAIIGLSTKKNLAINKIINAQDLATTNLVNKGKILKVIINQGNLLITSKGIALDTGKLGDVIRIQNSDSKRIIHATITSADTAEVTL